MVSIAISLAGFAGADVGGLEPVPVTIEGIPRALFSPDYRSQIDYRKWFQPAEVERAVLSPDGKRVAYVLREGDALSVMIVPLDGDAKPTLAQVLETADVNRNLTTSRTVIRPRIAWMQWVTDRRLVLETNRQTVTGSATHLPDGSEDESFVMKSGKVSWMAGEIMALNSDGRGLMQLVKPSDIQAPQGTPIGTRDVPRSPYILCVDPDHERSLIFGARYRPHALLPEIEVERMRLDVFSGKITSLDKTIRSSSAQVLLDRQGRERLMREKPSNQKTGVFHFTHFGRALPKTKDENLDARAGKKVGRSFGYTAAEFWGERAMPLGFGGDPAVLYFASNVGRDTWGVYGVNLLTRERLELAVEDPEMDLALPAESGFGEADLVMDRYRGDLAGVRAGGRTVWLQPLMQAMQTEIDEALPDVENRILDWDERQSIFLVETRSKTEPGVIRVYDSEKRTLTEVVKRIGGLDLQRVARVVTFSCVSKEGVKLDGVLTLPQSPKTARAPLIVMTPRTPFSAVPTGFDAEAQAFAEMGMATLRVNVRGAEGFGRERRESLKHGYGAGQVDDLLLLMDYAAEHFPVSRRMVAVMGREYGAYLALRAAEWHPKRFRCVVAADAVIDWAGELARDRDGGAMLAFWGDAEQVKASNGWPNVNAIDAAVLFLTRDFTEVAAQADLNLGDVRRLASKLKGQGTVAERFNLSTSYGRLSGAEKAGVFSRIEAFFNLNLFNYSVNTGEARVIEE